MAHVAPYKKEIVKKVVAKIKESPIVGIVDMENLPAQQLQGMREKLRGQVEMFMTKKRLMKIAFEEVGKDLPGIEKLSDSFKGMPALLFTKENPFKLFAILKKNKSSAPAKGGQIAPKDIIVKEGPTSFAPGPIIGQLGAFGIKTGVENGKLAIKADAVVCKEGEEISADLAGILTRLGVEPMEVGLDLVAIYEDGTIFKKDVLDVDEEEFRNDFMTAARDAFGLSLEIGYVTSDNIGTLLTKAERESVALAVESAFPADKVVEKLLAKAEAEASSVQANAA